MFEYLFIGSYPKLFFVKLTGIVYICKAKQRK